MACVTTSLVKSMEVITKKEPIILGIETSCDETAAAVICGRKILSDEIASSATVQAQFGGVVPEIASRAHSDEVAAVVERALKNAGIEQLPRTTQTTTQSTTQTTAQKILAIIKANPNVSRSALSREIGLSPDGIKWHLQKLKEGNAIRRVGPKYGGHWEVVE